MLGGECFNRESREVTDLYTKIGRQMVDGGRSGISSSDILELTYLRRELNEAQSAISELRSEIAQLRIVRG